jgi:hypothetical protein
MKAQITHGALPHSNDAVLPQICDSADTEFFLNNGIEHMLDVTAARPDADPAVLNLASLRLLTGLAPLASSNYMPKWVREPMRYCKSSASCRLPKCKSGCRAPSGGLAVGGASCLIAFLEKALTPPRVMMRCPQVISRRQAECCFQ